MKAKIILSILALLAVCAGCAIPNVPNPSLPIPTFSQPPHSESTDVPAATIAPATQPVTNIELPLPYPNSEMFDLKDVDAVLYDAAVEHYSSTGREGDLLIPSLALIDSYVDEKNTYYICWFRQFDFYGIGYGLDDMDNPEYILSAGAILSLFTVTTDQSGNLVCTEIEETWDGEGWPFSVRKICGPRTDLAEDIMNGATSIEGTRDITSADSSEMLKIYLDF